MKLQKKIQELNLERAQLLDELLDQVPNANTQDVMILGAIDIQIALLQRAQLKLQKIQDEG